MAEYKIDVVVDPNRARSGTRAVRGELNQTGQAAKQLHATLIKTFGMAGAVVAFKAAMGSAIKYRDALAEVSTLVDTTVFDMDRLAQAALEQSSAFAASPVQQIKAMYQIISAGAGDAATAVSVLDAANRLAVGGVTDVFVAADGLTSVLNAYGAAAGTATDVSDVLFVGMRAGKALDLDTPIPTPDRGFVPLRDIKDGDLVFNENGEVETVVYAHEVIDAAESYEVEFLDGTVVTACKDHNWLTYTDEDRRHLNKQKEAERYVCKSDRKRRGYRVVEPTVKTTADIINDFNPRKPKLFKYRHYVQKAKPVQFRERDLPIDPYLLGVWLGDGSRGAARISSADPEIVQAFVDGGYRVEKIKGDNYDYGVRAAKGMPLSTGSFLVQLRELGVLGNKHVPEEYMIASIDQRLALLRGLMDTDGYVDEGGRCEFVSVDRCLADAVKGLVDSLGMRATISTKEPRQVNHKTAYRVYFLPVAFVPFRLPRKAKRVRNNYRGCGFIAIVSIRKVAPRPMRCLTVTGDNALFLCGHNFIVTHNTTIQELSSSLGVVAPLAAQTGVSFEELVASVAALTKGGISTRISVTGVRAVLAAVIKPTVEAAAEAKRLGLEFDAAALKGKGLTDFLFDVVEKTGGSTDALAQLFGGVEALVPILALAGQAGVDFITIMEDMERKTGETNKALDKIAKSPGFQLRKFIQGMKNESLKLADALATSLNPQLKLLADNVEAVSGVIKILIVLIGVSLARKALPMLIGKVIALTGVLKTLWILMAAHPITAIIALVAAAASGYLLWQDRTESMEKAQERLNRKMLEAETAANRQREAIEALAAALPQASQAQLDALSALGLSPGSASVARVDEMIEHFKTKIREVEEGAGSPIVARLGGLNLRVTPQDEDRVDLTAYRHYAEQLEHWEKIRGVMRNIKAEVLTPEAIQEVAVVPSLGEIMAELAREATLLQLSNRERVIRAGLFAAEDHLGSQLVDSTGKLLTVEAGLIDAALRSNLALKEEDAIRKSVLGPIEEQERRLRILNELYMKGGEHSHHYANELDRIRIAQLALARDVGSGVERGLMKLEDAYTDYARAAEGALVNSFRAIEDTLVDLVVTGKASFTDLVNFILREVARLNIRLAITGPLSERMSSGAGNLFGGLFGGPAAPAGEIPIDPGDYFPGKRAAVASTGDTYKIDFHVTTPDADSFRKSEGQMYRRAGMALENFRRRR